MFHSELPWGVNGCRVKLSNRGWQTDTHIIIDGSRDQNQIAAVFYADQTDKLHAETFGNALMIIKAVNNYQKLEDALRAIVNAHANLLSNVNEDSAAPALYPAIDEARRLLDNIK